VLPGNASNNLVGSGFYISIYWINRQAEFIINYYALNLTVTAPPRFFCALSPNSLSSLRASAATIIHFSLN
jgi:hypothetical protein